MVKINTKPYQNTIKKVIIDDRETNRKDYALTQYKSFKPTIQHLPIGDYLFIGHDNTTVCIEYKTGNDFLTSINTIENHLHNQVHRMIQEYDYHFVLVECEDLDKLCTKRFYQTGLSMSVQEINGVVSELNTVSTVLFSQTMFGAFDLMMRQSGKLINQKPFLYKFGKKSSNIALNYLNCMYGLNNKAKDIVDTLNVSSVKDLMSLTVDDLMEVEGIGRKTAQQIITNIQGRG